LYKLEWGFLKRLLATFLGIAVFVVPGGLFFNVLDRPGHFRWENVLNQFQTYRGMYCTFLMPFPMLALLICSLLMRRINDRLHAAWKRNTLFLLVFTLSYIGYLSFAPWAIFRYLSILLPLAAILLALSAYQVLARYRLLGAVLLL